MKAIPVIHYITTFYKLVKISAKLREISQFIFWHVLCLKSNIKKSKAENIKTEDIEPYEELSYKKGEKAAIDLGQTVYAIKDLIVKMYEENQQLEARIKVLEALTIKQWITK